LTKEYDGEVVFTDPMINIDKLNEYQEWLWINGLIPVVAVTKEQLEAKYPKRENND
jgi:hypothetical protein